MGLKIGQKPMESVSPCIPGTAQGVQTSEVLQLPSGHLRLEMSRMLWHIFSQKNGCVTMRMWLWQLWEISDWENDYHNILIGSQFRMRMNMNYWNKTTKIIMFILILILCDNNKMIMRTRMNNWIIFPKLDHNVLLRKMDEHDMSLMKLG
jgi:hypothetical protein